MKNYYCIFSKDGENICGTWKSGNDEDEAIMKAEFAIACHYSNIEYDEVTVTRITE